MIKHFHMWPLEFPQDFAPVFTVAFSQPLPTLISPSHPVQRDVPFSQLTAQGSDIFATGATGEFSS